MTTLRTISQLSKASGVSTETIRYYEKINLLLPVRRLANGYRQFDDAALARLIFIKTCRSLDFALEDIRVLLTLQNEPQASCDIADTIVNRYLQTVREKITALQQVESFLQGIADCREQVVTDCKVIRTLQQS
ncbi:MerR family transcriptional regulator [Neisseria montereyensis]|uniref:MerR family transcriptional regulator n=1 Tax=Neisseria montereyensis TaxID=2973938 RepID=A0ABT2F985_9NEIS|nr:MerR family transcriptional regulator [Neisseria montereyensis]MCS4532761.1 MerR family transcriptional regulator [Neisseria montereyensis]